MHPLLTGNFPNSGGYINIDLIYLVPLLLQKPLPPHLAVSFSFLKNFRSTKHVLTLHIFSIENLQKRLKTDGDTFAKNLAVEYPSEFLNFLHFFHFAFI